MEDSANESTLVSFHLRIYINRLTDRHELMNNYSTCVFWVTWVFNPIHHSSAVTLDFLCSEIFMHHLCYSPLVCAHVFNSLTSREEAPPPPAATSQWGRGLRGPHKGSQRCLPPWPPGSLASAPTQDALQGKKREKLQRMFPNPPPKTESFTECLQKTHRTPPALQDRCPSLQPYLCPRKHTCQHRSSSCERLSVCPHASERKQLKRLDFRVLWEMTLDR